MSPENPLRVVIVDDHPLYRDGVAATLQEIPSLSVVGKGGSAADAIRLADELHPDLMMLDLSMPGGGLSALDTLRSSVPKMRIIVLTVSEYDEDVLSALRMGAHGYVLKGIDAVELRTIALSVACGDSYVSPALAARILAELRSPGMGIRPTEAVEDDPLASLTRREETILAFVADGRSNKEIARQIGLQEKSVKNYMTRILQKLHVRNRTEAAILLAGARRS